MEPSEFRRLIRQKGEELYRTMPWREDTRPYYVLVSELMLQQTQVDRVILKFNAFITAFPDETALAGAKLSDVLNVWQGLGYNRRAKFLHEAAKKITHELGGVWPANAQDLQQLPGVGPNTAGAISAYAYNQPAIFVETNIRTVYFLHYFSNNEEVDDKEVRVALEETLDKSQPREFYWALMDYGSWLKAHGVRNNASSRHYKKQSPLEGSVRQVRGQIVAVLVQKPLLTKQELYDALVGDERFDTALQGLLKDKLVVYRGNKLQLGE